MIIKKEEFEKFEQRYTFILLTTPTYRYGQAFINYFHPEAGEFLLEHSNLGTPPGIYEPNDDEILYNIKSATEAKCFIEERFKIV